MEYDINNLKASLQNATTAFEVAQINKEIEHAQRIMDEVARKNAQRDRIIVQGAEANIEQKKLLEEQNAQLKENYSLLKELYENTKKEAQNNLKEAKRSRVFGWVSFVVGTVIGVVGIIVGIIL